MNVSVSRSAKTEAPADGGLRCEDPFAACCRRGYSILADPSGFQAHPATTSMTAAAVQNGSAAARSPGRSARVARARRARHGSRCRAHGATHFCERADPRRGGTASDARIGQTPRIAVLIANGTDEPLNVDRRRVRLRPTLDIRKAYGRQVGKADCLDDEYTTQAV